MSVSVSISVSVFVSFYVYVSIKYDATNIFAIFAAMALIQLISKAWKLKGSLT
jgi:hypothetical protein